MNYHFVFDKSLKDLFFELSEEELRVVCATHLGNHNALFYGYKPERLVHALEVLSEQTTEVASGISNILKVKFIPKGMVVIKDLYTETSGCSELLYKYSVNTERKIQLVCTSRSTPGIYVYNELLRNIDIVYKCLDSKKDAIPISSVKDMIKRSNNARDGWLSGAHTM